MIIVGFSVCLLLSLYLTGWLRAFSIRKNWFDWPTDRSSHLEPVPNIGGLAISLVTIVALVLLTFAGKFTLEEFFLWAFVVALLSFVGFWDDVRNLSTVLRLIVHIVIALVVVKSLGGINGINLGVINFEFGKFSYLLGFIWVVGFINMYNFMDGINTLAGAQAIIAGLVFALWLYFFGLPSEALLMLAIAAASAGFLYWNITPAKVFMGDSGSTMLGGVFAAMSLKLHNEAGLSILLPALVFAWFLLDTSLTMAKRALNGEKIWQAHRQHLYQRMAPNPDNHIKVTGMISLLTLIISLIITMVVFKQTSV